VIKPWDKTKNQTHKEGRSVVKMEQHTATSTTEITRGFSVKKHGTEDEKNEVERTTTIHERQGVTVTKGKKIEGGKGRDGRSPGRRTLRRD